MRCWSLLVSSGRFSPSCGPNAAQPWSRSHHDADQGGITNTCAEPGPFIYIVHTRFAFWIRGGVSRCSVQPTEGGHTGGS
jgi:hypothetical protein